MKRKPIEMIKNKNTPLIKMEDELSTLVQFQENIMAQIIDRQDEAYADFLVNQIIAFMKENNVSTCFVLNKEELLDCLKEHNKLHCEILNLQSQLDQANERLKGAIVPKFKIGQEVFIVNTDYYYKKDYKVEKHKIVGIEDKVDRKNTYVRWYSLEFKDCPASYSKRYKFLEKNVFATETEAEKKLQELRGGE